MNIYEAILIDRVAQHAGNRLAVESAVASIIEAAGTPASKVIGQLIAGTHGDEALRAWAKYHHVPLEKAQAILAHGERGETLPKDAVVDAGLSRNRVAAAELWDIGHAVGYIRKSVDAMHAYGKGSSGFTNLRKDLHKNLVSRYRISPATAEKIIASALGQPTSGEPEATAKVVKRDRVVGYSPVYVKSHIAKLVAYLNSKSDKKNKTGKEAGRWHSEEGFILVLKHPIAEARFKLLVDSNVWVFVGARPKWGRDPSNTAPVPREEWGIDAPYGMQRGGRPSSKNSAAPGLTGPRRFESVEEASSTLKQHRKAITRVTGQRFLRPPKANINAIMRRSIAARGTSYHGAPEIVKLDMLRKTFGDKWPDIEHRIIPMINAQWRVITQDAWQKVYKSGKKVAVRKDPAGVKVTTSEHPMVTVHHSPAGQEAIIDLSDEHGWVDHKEVSSSLTKLGFKSAAHAAGYARAVQNDARTKAHVRKVEVGGTFKSYQEPDEDDLFTEIPTSRRSAAAAPA